MQELLKARADYNLPAALERLDRYPLLLLIDDIGYVRRDERRSVLITANQPFTAREETCPSSSMTVAAVERRVHRGGRDPLPSPHALGSARSRVHRLWGGAAVRISQPAGS